MAQAKSERQTPATLAQTPDIEALMASNGEMMKALMKANEAMMEGMVAVGREILDFGNTRVRHDLDAQGEMMKCGSPEALFSLQCDFAREATEQYFNELNKLMTLTTQVARDCWTPIEEGAKAQSERATGA